MRIERDSMGEMSLPNDALYGASTQRAVLNFPVSSLRFPKEFISALGTIKWAAAKANQKLGLIDEKRAKAILSASEEVVAGILYDQFVVDLFQTGSGTSTNMNANEVIANRSTELLGGKRGDKSVVHPNDHVNMSQSSNDVIPSAIHISSCLMIKEHLFPALKNLESSLDQKSHDFSSVIKSGRTHLQDATPITLGQEFSGYAAQIKFGIERIERSFESLAELALGGTAVGTGLNTHPEFPKLAIGYINDRTGINFREAQNHFEAQAAQDSCVEMSGQLKTVACSLIKIANDIRWLSSGPRCNIGEIQLPEIQPGSSIMPAKVNPVICESVIMVSARVIGNDATITTGGLMGNFELNVMLPIIAYCLLESIELIASVSTNFVNKCIDEIKANEDRCKEFAEKSLAICTALAPKIGYDKAAKVAKQALAENKTVRQVVKELNLLSAHDADSVLDLMYMTKPNKENVGSGGG